MKKGGRAGAAGNALIPPISLAHKVICKAYIYERTCEVCHVGGNIQVFVVDVFISVWNDFLASLGVCIAPRICLGVNYIFILII